MVQTLLFVGTAMNRDKIRKALISGTILAALVAIAVGIPAYKSVRRARHILETEKQNLRTGASIRVQQLQFTPAPSTRVRLWPGPAQVRDAVEYQDSVYAATGSGLVKYSREGRIEWQWTTADGLPSLDLTSLAVRDDALWIGTADAGLLRLQNDTWSQFLPQDLPLRSIHSLLNSTHGPLFIGTASGILKFDGKEFTPFYKDKLAKATVTVLAGDALTLWIGTYNSGLYLFEKGAMQHFGPEQGLTDSLITDVEPAGPGNAYISTPSGIHFLKDGQWQPIWKGAFVQTIHTGNEALWAATQDQGIVRVPLSAALRRSAELRSVVPDTGKTAATLRKVGNTLVAFVPERSWYLAEGGKWKIWNEPQGVLSDGNISSLLRTIDGKTWVGYFDRGLDILDANFQRISHLQDDVYFCINYLSQDTAGNIYVSTANGLAVVAPDGTRRVYRQSDGLLSDRVMQAVPVDPDGKRVAIATSQGFTLMENGNLKSLYAFHGLVNNHVYSIAARGDQIFVGTLGGISRIRDMQVVSNWTQMDSGLRRNWVNALLTLDNNRLLVGTYGSGIQERTDTGDWSGFASLPDDFEVNPNAFFYDGRYVFCGTLDRGVYIFDTRQNTWKQLRAELPSMNVTAFEREGASMYIATDRGLLQVSYDDISTHPDLR